MARSDFFRPFRLLTRLPHLAGSVFRHGLPSRLLLFGPLSPGDDLLCTTVLREARRRGMPFAMMTNRPELFEHNEDPADLIPVDDYYAQALRSLGRKVVKPYYAGVDPAEPDRDVFGSGHILARMCQSAGIMGRVTLRPYVHVSEREMAAGRQALNQIAFQSTVAGAVSPFANKEWFPARFAEVVDRLPENYQAVQLGLESDPPLPGAIDLRGKTSLRQAAAVLASSRAFVGLEGFIGHMARAVDCPSVLVLGGRALTETVGYPGNEYLAAPTSCAPCGLRSQCQYQRACLDGVTVDDVLSAIGRLLNRPRGPLPEATVEI